MFKLCSTCALTLLFASSAHTAQAFFDLPWITPAAPRAGETVSVNIRDGICDAFFFRPGFPQITQQGNAIRLLEYGQHWDTADLCVFEIGQLTEPIGAFPPGDYTLTVDLAYDDALYGPTVMSVGVVAFTVAGVTAAAPIPASSPAALFVLLLFVFAATFCALRTRRQSR